MTAARATALLCVAVCLIGSGASAAGGLTGDYRDPASGLEVKVPPGFVRTAAQPMDGVMMKRAGDEGVFCDARFEAGGENAAPPRPTTARGFVKDAAKRWRGSRAGKARIFVSAAPYPARSADPAAVAIVSDRRGDLVGYPRQKRRSLTIVWETAKGRTTLDCEAPKVRFGILRREFEALAGGVTPPE